MYLGIDCETSGLSRAHLPPEDPSQPHLVQLGLKTWNARWEPRASVSLLVQPDGWTIEPEAERVHGISQAQAMRAGVRLGVALLILQDLAATAKTIFAHNMQYDRLIITAALYRTKASGIWWARRAGDMRCTMEEATPLCQLPGQYGSFKYPDLEEAHAILLPGEATFKTRHDALSDIEAAARVLRKIDSIRAEAA